MRLAPPCGLASDVLHVVSQNHGQQLERVVTFPRHRSRFGQFQKGYEALLDRVQRIVGVEAALAGVGEQPLPVDVDELCDPPQKPGRRVEAGVSRLVVLEKLCGQSHGYIPIGRLERERYTAAGARYPTATQVQLAGHEVFLEFSTSYGAGATTELIRPIAEPQQLPWACVTDLPGASASAGLARRSSRRGPDLPTSYRCPSTTNRWTSDALPRTPRPTGPAQGGHVPRAPPVR